MYWLPGYRLPVAGNCLLFISCPSLIVANRKPVTGNWQLSSLFHLLSQRITDLHQYFINPVTVHVNYFDLKSLPFQFVASFGYSLQAMKNKARECVEILFTFIHPLRLFKFGKKIIKGYLSVYQETSITPFPSLHNLQYPVGGSRRRLPLKCRWV